MIDKIFKQRQKKLLQAIEKNAIVILFATKEPNHHRKTVNPFRQDSDFYYLTGFEESEAIAVFIHDRNSEKYILFCQKKDPAEEVWTGKRIGQAKAVQMYGADEAFSLAETNHKLAELISGHKQLYCNLSDHEDRDRILEVIKKLKGKERSGVNAPMELIDIGKISHEMRMRKDKTEIATLRQACKISAAAHARAMKVCKPDMMEYELEAEIMHEFIRHGGRMPAFEPIIAGGENACTLHYTQNNMKLKSGDLVLIDAGVEYKHYAGDISRTFPVNGKFNTEQRAIYQAVLDTQLAVIKAIKPGVKWFDLHSLSERLITEKLIKLGLLRGKLEDLLEKKAFKPFYMHFIGHWLGIDVHDVGSYKIRDNLWREVEPGMVFTVEPGIYISPNIPGINKKWAGIGVRIEDNVLVTKTGCEVLTSDAPKTIDEIESLMRTKK